MVKLTLSFSCISMTKKRKIQQLLTLCFTKMRRFSRVWSGVSLSDITSIVTATLTSERTMWQSHMYNRMIRRLLHRPSSHVFAQRRKQACYVVRTMAIVGVQTFPCADLFDTSEKCWCRGAAVGFDWTCAVSARSLSYGSGLGSSVALGSALDKPCYRSHRVGPCMLTAVHRTTCVLCDTVLVPTRPRPGSAFPALCVFHFLVLCVSWVLGV